MDFSIKGPLTVLSSRKVFCSTARPGTKSSLVVMDLFGVEPEHYINASGWDRWAGRR